MSVSAVDADVLVIGTGAAGIAAARAARERGATVGMLGEGSGSTSLGGGVLWGSARDPFAQWASPDEFHVGGRYVGPGARLIAGAVGALGSLLDLGSLPAVGPLGVMDFDTHPSWSARLVAETVGGVVLRVHDAPSGESFGEVALGFDTEGVLEAFADALAPKVRSLAGVLFPPVLGLRRDDVAKRLRARLGVSLGESAGLAGDPPGVRLRRAMERWVPSDVRRAKGRAKVEIGRQPRVSKSDGATVRCKAVVLATGGITGGGLRFGDTLEEATAGAAVWTRLRERVLVRAGSIRGADPMEWFDEHHGKAIGAGVRVNDSGRVLEPDGETAAAEWLFAAGDVVALGRFGDGLAGAIASGAHAGREAALHALGR